MSARRLLLFLTLLFVAACRQQPEGVPTATLPSADVEVGETAVPTNTPLPPTATIPPTEVPPTVTALPTETPVPPTATAPPPTATPDVTLAVTAPEAEATLEVGSEVTVAGEAAPGGEPLTISLEAAGVTLVENSVPLEENTTTWETVLAIPESFTGRVFLRVSQSGETTVDVPVLLERPATSGTTISLTYPDEESSAVASQVLFFQGRVQQPIDGEITIAVLYEECQTVGAQQTFEVGEGGQWWGYVVVPESVFGPACAVAYTGGFEEEGWRAASTPLTILEADDPAARGIFVGNFAFEEVSPGETVTVFGRAYNTDEVDISLQVGGQALASGTTDVDQFGYWEIDLTLPAGAAPGSDGFFVATATYGGETVMARGSFLVAGGESDAANE